MQYLIIGVLLCAILAVTTMENHHLILIQAAKNLPLNQVIFRFIYDLSLYIIPVFFIYSFKKVEFFYSLVFYWVSLDVIGYSGVILGWEKHAFFAIFSLVTLSYFAIQYKHNVNIVISFGIMVLFQIAMVMDWFNGNSETILYTNYHYILTGIHLLIISTMVKWTIISRCRAYLDYYCGRIFLVFG